GAGRWRIARQMITESLLLAMLGGTFGTLLAIWGVNLLVTLSADNIPSTAHVRIDLTVLGFTLLMSLVTGLLFGLAPALRAMKLSLSDSLKEGGRGGADHALRNRTRSLLIVLESAVAVVLLVGAGLLIRSLIGLQEPDRVLVVGGVLTARIDLPQQKYETADKRANFFEQLQARLSSLPGVESVGLISELPLSGQPNDMPYALEGQPPDTAQFDDDFRRVNLDYFRSLRIPFLRGRNFT